MTRLTIQRLHIPDCESAVQRSYFDWGRCWDEHSPDPEWETASPDVKRRLMLRGYGIYDGWPPLYGNEVGLTEAYVSTGINSRVILIDTLRFLVRAEQARPLLERIPDQARLEEATDDQLAAAGALLDLFTSARYVGIGKTTKVLHNKRPAFIPVLDSVVCDFLCKNFPHRLSGTSSLRDCLVLFRDVLIAKGDALGEVQRTLAELGLIFSTARLLSHLIWLGWNQRVDEIGFGSRLTEVWQTRTLQEARERARQTWEGEERSSSSLATRLT